jgi:hypothetical protein
MNCDRVPCLAGSFNAHNGGPSGRLCAHGRFTVNVNKVSPAVTRMYCRPSTV